MTNGSGKGGGDEQSRQRWRGAVGSEPRAGGQLPARLGVGDEMKVHAPQPTPNSPPSPHRLRHGSACTARLARAPLETQRTPCSTGLEAHACHQQRQETEVQQLSRSCPEATVERTRHDTWAAGQRSRLPDGGPAVPASITSLRHLGRDARSSHQRYSVVESSNHYRYPHADMGRTRGPLPLNGRELGPHGRSRGPSHKAPTSHQPLCRELSCWPRIRL